MITRPTEDAQPLARLLEAEGHHVIIEPLLSIELHDDAPLDFSGVQAILITSANGARALAQNTTERGTAVLCVGAATAAAARALGFTNLRSANGDVEDLAALARETYRPEAGPLVHVAGSVVAGDLAGRLETAGFTVRRAVLYEAVPSEALSPVARAAIAEGNIDTVLLYSPRTAARFASLIVEAKLGRSCRAIDAICLSKAVAEALGDLPLRRKLVARRPDQEALLDLMGGALA